jgi:hypothetical protein
MNSDFENRLQDQPMRQIPGEWRSQILGATTRAGSSTLADRLSTWLWPHPRAWAGLAAAWVVILLLHFTAADDSRVARHSSPITFQSLAIMEQQTLAIAQSLGPNDAGEPSTASPTPPTPRSERPRKQLIG